ncbi:MAG: Na+ dependent nucleoside transporter [Bacteroidetes bacterium]|nr:MAG: Na+ dependent nucleoside transporter [Bacteroidota bacterium]RLD95212.1 MAG: Na+ dependent nucleoside transporter [Bacteroidota bacterium]
MITDTLMVDTVLAVIQQAPIESVPLSNIIPEKAGFTFDLVRLLRGMMGMAVLIAIAYVFSNNRKAVNWKMVGTGLLFQLILAIGILYIPFVQVFFEFIGKGFVKILAFTGEGVNYLLKRNDTGATDPALQNFAFSILPTIIFFAAFSSLLFYLGVIQIFVKGFGYVLSRALGLSGPESLSVAGNIFLGQTESPLLIKPYLEKMNKSEILLVMSGGMATLAGGVLAAYIGFLGGGDPVQQVIFAKHLLTASIMAAPGVVVISKIIVPQTEQIDKTIEVSKEEVGKNALDAISNGTGDGLRLAVNVGAMLLVFIAFIAFANYIFVKIGDWTSLNDRILSFTNGKYDELSLEFILGYAFSPLMWLIGVAKEDITLVGSLLGKKLILTEFVAYIDLADMKAASSFTDTKSIIMSVYMLCGFANFASIGIQIGGIGALAPGRRVLLARFGMRALLAGTLASLLSATIIGVLMG